MKRLTSLWCALASELGFQLGVHVDRDIKTVTARVKSESISFLTITLPQYGADFEKALEDGVIDPTLFRAFRKNGRAPAFMQGFLGRVFDVQSGAILPAPDAQCVWAIRQLSLVFKKIELECKPEVLDAAYERYEVCDDEVGITAENILSRDALFAELRHVFTALFWAPLRDLDEAVATYALAPRHGPGSTADRRQGNQKWVMDYWPERFEELGLFPYREYALPRYGLDELVPPLTPEELETPVRVVDVPKTLSSPRIIAMEPTCMMYMQQGISSHLVPRLERDRLVGPMIGFEDQDPNREMAKIGSSTGRLATLDLKEASDRVPYRLVEKLVKPIAPHAWEAMDASRSRRADVRGSVRTLNKFASMGSALCFPTEAMFFLSVVFVGLLRAHHGTRLSVEFLQSMHGQVRVYGDDIVCPAYAADSVREALRDFGLVVNEGKSFSHGKFRESCGGDYFDGEFVTPVKVRQPFPSSNRDATQLVSWTATMNQFYLAGLWKTAAMVQSILEGYLGPLPIVPTTSQALGLHSFQGSASGTRMSPKLHVPQVKAWVASTKVPSNPIDGYYALRKCFAGDFYESRNAGHLEVSGRPSAVRLKRKWVNVEEMAS